MAKLDDGGTPRRPKTAHEGLIRPYRPKPKDFLEVYARLGWDGIEEHYRTNWRCIRRWIIEEGADRCKAARKAYLAQHGINVRRYEIRGSRRSDYVLGRRMRPARRFDWGNIPVGAQLCLSMGDLPAFSPPASVGRKMALGEPQSGKN